MFSEKKKLYFQSLYLPFCPFNSRFWVFRLLKTSLSDWNIRIYFEAYLNLNGRLVKKNWFETCVESRCYYCFLMRTFLWNSCLPPSFRFQGLFGTKSCQPCYKIYNSRVKNYFFRSHCFTYFSIFLEYTIIPISCIIFPVSPPFTRCIPDFVIIFLLCLDSI